MNNSGIYTITCKVNSKIYIGRSRNIKNRKLFHFQHLRENNHHNEYLQRAWNKHGEENFEFEVLEECEEQFLASQENYWCNLLNTHSKKYGYNNAPTHPEGVTILTEETKLKISRSRK